LIVAGGGLLLAQDGKESVVVERFRFGLVGVAVWHFADPRHVSVGRDTSLRLVVERTEGGSELL